MAPSRKSRSVNKRFANEVSPSKLMESSTKSKQKKRKVSDNLGPQWTKQELERFYQAYREHGKDWKKVATVVRNRSQEMVEALYLMNKAYLSLPEGAASVVGLVAMMIDHYNVLGRSDSDRESNEGEGPSRPKKRAKGNHSYKSSDKKFADPPAHAVGSSDDYLSLFAKKPRSETLPRVVRKRTPRVPFSYSGKDKEKSSPTKQKLKFGMNVVADDVAHEIAMALTKASQRVAPGKASQMANRKHESASPSPLKDGGKIGTGPQATSSKARYTSFHDGRKISLGVKGDVNRENFRGKSHSNVRKGAGAVDFQEKGKNRSTKKREVENSAKKHLDDINEASNNKNERKLSAAKRKGQAESLDGKGTVTLSKGPQKRSRKSLFGDEDSPFDALQTLADMSLMMRSTTDVTESAEGKEENVDGANEKHAVSANEEPPSIPSQVGKSKTLVHESPSGVQRRKQKSPMKLQAHEKEAQADPCLSDNRKIEATQEAKGSMYNGQQSAQNAESLLEQLVNPLGFTFTVPKSKKKVNESVTYTAEVPSKESRTGLKTDIEKPLTTKDSRFGERVSDFQLNLSNHKERISNCLSRRLTRRWCTFEWFYSAIDYPWFARSEFVEYLQHVALDHVPRLTRVEWNVIKGSLGRPRRFSDHFLKEEREKLNQYRESVRKHYAELGAGSREGLPTDLARPLSVGQCIVAIHPKTRELHNGTIVTVEHRKYCVKFDPPGIGVEFVMDFECMPLNPTEILSASLRKRNQKELQINNQFMQLKTHEPVKDASSENLVNAQSCSISPSIQDIDELLKCKEPPIEPQIRTKDADVQAVSDLFRALDKKEAVVSELRYMHDQLLNDNDKDNPLNDSELFKKLYAAVILRLNEVNEQVSSAISSLRERNTKKIIEPKKNHVPISNDHGGGRLSSVTPSAPYIYKEIGSQVEKIVESSRMSAQKVVGVAMKAILTLEKMGETWESTEEAINFVNNRLSQEDFDPTAVMKPSSEQTPMGPSTELPTSQTTDLDPNCHYDQHDPKIPSELIAHCVATLLMIQKCTERQFPPSEVAKVLDSAVTSLQPLWPKNLSVYEEIQKYMGIIRTQILALIPT